MQCGETEKNLLLNGRFQYEEINAYDWCHTSFKTPACKFQLPFVLAASFSSLKVLEIFLQNGCNVLQQDIEGNNVLHGVIISAALRLNKDYRTVYNLLIDNLPIQKLRTLLHMENYEGYRPLEYAAKMQTFDLVDSILKTRDVYAIHRSTEGVYEHVWYDVTDYESINASRQDKSPLLHLTQMSKEGISQAGAQRLLLSQVITAWINVKLSSNKPCFALWFFFRTVYHVFVVISSRSINQAFTILSNGLRVLDIVNKSNYTAGEQACTNVEKLKTNLSDCEKYVFEDIVCGRSTAIAIVIIIGAVSALMVLVDIVNVVKRTYQRMCSQKKRSHYPMGGKLISTLFYTRVNSFLNLSLTVTTILLFIKFTIRNNIHTDGPMVTVATVMFLATTLLNIWSYLFFFQFLPYIGHFVVTIQKMLADMASFIAIYFIFIIGFSQAFHNALFITGNCAGTGFEGFSDSLYSTFTVMLNMVDFSKYVQTNFTIGIVHMLYVLFVAVLLLNFLVALMSGSVILVKDNEAFLMKLQRLHVALLLEYHARPVFKFVYKYANRKHLIIEDGKLYVSCLEMLE